MRMQNNSYLHSLSHCGRCSSYLKLDITLIFLIYKCVCPIDSPLRAQSLQLCPRLCDPMYYNLPGSLSMGFSRQESWSGLPCPPPGDLPHPGIEPTSLASFALTGRLFTTSNTLLSKGMDSTKAANSFYFHNTTHLPFLPGA